MVWCYDIRLDSYGMVLRYNAGFPRRDVTIQGWVLRSVISIDENCKDVILLLEGLQRYFVIN